jgi:hypothetical protein
MQGGWACACWLCARVANSFTASGGDVCVWGGGNMGWGGGNGEFMITIGCVF